MIVFIHAYYPIGYVYIYIYVCVCKINMYVYCVYSIVNVYVYCVCMVYIVYCGSITLWAKRDMPMIRDSETSTSIGADGQNKLKTSPT